MPDTVRLLFQPVLRPSEGGTGKNRNRGQNFRPVRSPNGNQALDLPSRPVDGRAVEVSPARRGAGTARAGSTVTTQVLPSSRLQNPESGAGPGLANAGSLAAAGSLASPGAVPSADLLAITPTTQDPLQADVLVATPALQSQFGIRLSTEYAPAVLASFGTGNARVDVRVVAAYGASAYQLALNRDLAARELLGTH